ncbi:MAG: hypothetical protein MJ096_02275 [Clostridia bacterium]|nr:hypothetical protein [Clostridia bacterium]
MSKKGTLIIICCTVLGVILLALPLGKGKTDTAAPAPIEAESYTERLEERVRELCSSVRGVGEVTVLLTLESGSELVYASNKTGEKDADGSSSGTTDYLIIDGGDGDAPLLVKEIYPRVRGVAVVCRGGCGDGTRAELTELLSASLGISANRIKIA